VKITIDLDTIISRVQAKRARERTLREAGIAVLRDWKKAMTEPPDRSHLLAGATPGPQRVPKVGELLFEFLRGHDRIRCELRDHGPFGVEAQFLINEELFISRTFHPRLDPMRTPRDGDGDRLGKMTENRSERLSELRGRK
jgi:hypothetical protein